MAHPDAAPSDRKAALIARVTGIITKPDLEWLKIDIEPATIASLYKGYIIPLAAIPAVCRFVGEVVFGYSVMGITYRPSFFSALSSAIASYVLSLAGVFILALIVEFLAPTFEGDKNRVQALKLVAYSATASWVAGIFLLIPGLRMLSILGLYSLYLFYRGIPAVMRSPREKTVAYTAVVIVAAIVISLVIAPIAGLFQGSPGALQTGNSTAQLPGGTVLYTDRLNEAAKRMEEAQKRAQSGQAPATIPVDTLKAMLPPKIAGLTRQELTSSGGQVAGYGGAVAEAKYAGDGKSITLAVTDLGAAGAMAAMGGALGVSGSQETATSYSKMSQVDGRTVMEEYDRGANSGSYGLVTSDRFLVKAEGEKVSMDDLKAAVGSIDLAALDALAK